MNIENDIKIRYIKTRLEKLISEPQLIDSWLNSPNSAFGNKKPIDLIINGDTNELYRMLYVLETGEPLLWIKKYTL